jgi:hypothetical protein
VPMRRSRAPKFYARLDRVLDGPGSPAAKAARVRRMIEGAK